MPTKWTPQRLKALRKRLQLNQDEFGPLLGYTAGGVVSRLEKGKRDFLSKETKILDQIERRANRTKDPLEKWTPSKIRELRLILGMTTGQMASELCYANNTSVRELERGYVQPSQEQINIFEKLEPRAKLMPPLYSWTPADVTTLRKSLNMTSTDIDRLLDIKTGTQSYTHNIEYRNMPISPDIRRKLDRLRFMYENGELTPQPANRMPDYWTPEAIDLLITRKGCTVEELSLQIGYDGRATYLKSVLKGKRVASDKLTFSLSQLEDKVSKARTKDN